MSSTKILQFDVQTEGGAIPESGLVDILACTFPRHNWKKNNFGRPISFGQDIIGAIRVSSGRQQLS